MIWPIYEKDRWCGAAAQIFLLWDQWRYFMFLTFQTKHLFFKCTFSNKATSAFARGNPRHITMDFVWLGGTDAAVALLRNPPLMDANAESRTDFVWFYISSAPCSSKWLFLQNETIPKPDHHRCREEQAKCQCILTTTCVSLWNVHLNLCYKQLYYIFPCGYKSQDKSKNFELIQFLLEATVQL